MKTEKTAQTSAFWDIFVLKEDGEWMGLRAPWVSFRRVISVLTLLFALSAVGVTGWLLSRWQAGRLDRLLSLERLKSQALENQLADLRSNSGGAGIKIDTGTASFLPLLGPEELTSTSVSLNEPQAGYDPVSHEFHVSFELVRQGPHEGTARYYWILLLHGSQGLVSVPPAFASRAGEALQFHRGQVVDDVKIRRSVSARFKLPGFFETETVAHGSEPVYATLLLYDAKGSLLARKRQEISFSRAAAPSGKGEE